MENPYETLGVAPNATSDEIRKAYRKLAKTLHPDLNPGNMEAEERFKAVSSAHDILSDPEKRRRFDNGEIDASGAERPQERYYKEYAGGGAGANPYRNTSGFSDFGGAEDIFADLFRQQARRQRNIRGEDLNYSLTVDFLDAINGGKKRISLPDGGSLDLTIPAGLQDGQILRLRGKGAPSRGQGEAGDALVSVSVRPHRLFVRKGNDILLDLPVTLSEAVLGGRLKVPTPSGDVMVTIPKGSNTGKVLRLKGKGVPHGSGQGDELVTIRVMLPTKPDEALEAFLATWDPGPDYTPREDLRT